MAYMSVEDFPTVLSRRIMVTDRKRCDAVMVEKVMEWSGVYARLSRVTLGQAEAEGLTKGKFVDVPAEERRFDGHRAVWFSTDEDEEAIFDTIRGALLDIRSAEKCFRCGGTGRVVDKYHQSYDRECYRCNGTGNNPQKGNMAQCTAGIGGDATSNAGK